MVKKYGGQNRRQRKRPSKPTGRTFAPGSTQVPGMYTLFTREGERKMADEIAVVNTSSTCMDENVTALKNNLVLPAMLEYIDSVPTVDKYNASEIDSFADYVIYSAELLAQLKGIKFIIDVFKSFTRSDTTPGSPLTRATWNGLVASLVGQILVPYLSVNLAGFLATPIVLNFPVESRGYMHTYYFPYLPSMDYDNLESLLSTMMGEHDGLVASNQFQRLGRAFQASDVQYTAPVLPNSEGALAHFMYAPAKDDAATKEEEFDTSTLLYYDVLAPPGVYYDYMRLLGIGTASGAEFIKHNASAPSAGKINLKYGAIEDTSLTEASDFAAGAANNRIWAGNFRLQQEITGGSGIDPSEIKDTIHFFPAAGGLNWSETVWNRKLIQILKRDMGSERFSPAMITTGFKDPRIMTRDARNRGYSQAVSDMYKTQWQKTNQQAAGDDDARRSRQGSDKE